jgi:hypothetical protein
MDLVDELTGAIPAQPVGAFRWSFRERSTLCSVFDLWEGQAVHTRSERSRFNRQELLVSF